MNLYHYCPMSTFEAIINNKGLRLSDISKSNDCMELSYAIPIIEKTLQQAVEVEKTKVFLNNVDKNLFYKSFYDWSKSHLGNAGGVCYAICFSQCADLLSQWRGYADDASGVAMGFDLEGLKNSSIVGLELSKVLYDKRIQKGNARRVADIIVRDIKNRAKKSKVTEKDLIECFDSRTDDYLRIMACFKSPFFKEEKEWRLYSYLGKVGTEKYMFQRADCKKYIDIDLSSVLTSSKKMHVVLGPKCKAREEDIKGYLASKDIDANVQKSEGSYI